MNNIIDFYNIHFENGDVMKFFTEDEVKIIEKNFEIKSKAQTQIYTLWISRRMIRLDLIVFICKTDDDN